MSAKIANVIAIELGILIAVLSWLAFSEFSRLKPHPVTEDLRAPEGSYALVRPAPQRPAYQPNAANYSAGQQQPLLAGAQPTVQPNQNIQYGALNYDQAATTTPYTVVDDTPADTTPIYYDPYSYGGYQQPTIPYPDDYYYLPNDYGYYPYPGQIIVVTNNRVARERSRNCFMRPPMQVAPRRAPGGQFRPPPRPSGGRDSRSPGGLIGPRPRAGGGGGLGGAGGGRAVTRGGGGAHSSRAGVGTQLR